MIREDAKPGGFFSQDKSLYWAVVAAQLVERSLPTPEIRSLNPIRDINDQHLKAKPYWGSHWLFLVGYLIIILLGDVWSPVGETVRTLFA